MAETDYKSRCEEYENRMGIGQNDPAKDGYLVMVSILRQQNEYLKTFKISSKIASDEKADMTAYKNAKDLWENLPKMIEAVSSLRISLKMDGEEIKKQYTPITAKQIANGEM